MGQAEAHVTMPPRYGSLLAVLLLGRTSFSVGRVQNFIYALS